MYPEEGKFARHKDTPFDATTLRWLAVLSDVDHEVEPVTSGARVTLVYELADPRFAPHGDLTPGRLVAPLARDVIAGLDRCVTFVPENQIENDGGGEYPHDDPVTLAPYMLSGRSDRSLGASYQAATTLIHEAFFDQDGFGRARA